MSVHKAGLRCHGETVRQQGKTNQIPVFPVELLRILLLHICLFPDCAVWTWEQCDIVEANEFLTRHSPLNRVNENKNEKNLLSIPFPPLMNELTFRRRNFRFFFLKKTENVTLVLFRCRLASVDLDGGHGTPNTNGEIMGDRSHLRCRCCNFSD